MKRFLLPFFLLAFGLLLTVSSCKTAEPGFGGEASINGSVKHHDEEIPDAIVYIAFGTLEFPGTDVNLYDHSIVASGQGVYTINGLEKGDYYLYAIGFDAAVNEQVVGGIPISITKSEQNAFEDIAVTE